MDAGSERKGKYFTHVVSKDKVPVVLHVNNCRIEGDFYLKKNERFSDALNDSYQFISIVDARVIFDDAVIAPIETPFMAVNREQIDWIFVKE